MKHIYCWTFVMLVFTSLLSSACAPKSEAIEKVPPSKLKPIEGTELNHVILTEKAVERLGIETALASGNAVPYAAVIYDIDGNTWVYTNPEPLIFVRAPISIDHIEGDTAVLSANLDSELQVVTVGVAELYGTETGVSK